MERGPGCPRRGAAETSTSASTSTTSTASTSTSTTKHRKWPWPWGLGCPQGQERRRGWGSARRRRILSIGQRHWPRAWPCWECTDRRMSHGHGSRRETGSAAPCRRVTSSPRTAADAGKRHPIGQSIVRPPRSTITFSLSAPSVRPPRAQLLAARPPGPHAAGAHHHLARMPPSLHPLPSHPRRASPRPAGLGAAAPSLPRPRPTDRPTDGCATD